MGQFKGLALPDAGLLRELGTKPAEQILSSCSSACEPGLCLHGLSFPFLLFDSKAGGLWEPSP